MSQQIQHKQETLEEAAENYRNYWLENKGLTLVDTFIAGAKWQQERMYNEEDMVEFMQFTISQESLSNTSSVSKDTALYYLTQFKKK